MGLKTDIASVRNKIAQWIIENPNKLISADKVKTIFEDTVNINEGLLNDKDVIRVDYLIDSNVTFTSLVNGASVDGITLVSGMVILLSQQTTKSENGVWEIQDSGTANRHDNYSTTEQQNTTLIRVQSIRTGQYDTFYRSTLTGIDIDISNMIEDLLLLYQGTSFGGRIEPSSPAPTTGSSPIFWLCDGNGTYTNFGDQTISEDIGWILWDGSNWDKVETTVTLATYQKKVSDGDLDMNNFNIIELKEAENLNDAVTLNQILKKGVAGVNLFNEKTILEEHYVYYASGAINSNANYYASNYIYIEGLTDLYIAQVNHLAFYDTDKIYISGINSTTNEVSVPASAVYIRFSTYISYGTSVQYLIEGTTPLSEYEKYYEKPIGVNAETVVVDTVLKGKVVSEGSNKDSIKSKEYIDNRAEQAVTDSFGDEITIEMGRESTNMIDPDNVVVDHYYRDASIANSSYSHSDYIPVLGSSTYRKIISADSNGAASFRFVSYFDASKTYLSYEEYKTEITTPSDARFVIVTFYSENHSTYPTDKESIGLFVDGIVDFEYYLKYYVRSKNIDHKSKDNDLDFLTKKELEDIFVQRNVDIVLPDEVIAIVDQPMQLFYYAMASTTNIDKYNVVIDCDFGRAFTRYWEHTPVVGDVGDHTFTIKLYTDEDLLVGSGTTTIKVSSAIAAPVTQKNVLIIGDSLNNSENDFGDVLAKMVVDGTELLAGSSIANIDFIGMQGSGNKKYTGYGGQRYSHYNTEQSADPTTADCWVKMAGHDKEEAGDQESIWQDSSGNNWQLETINADWLFLKRQSHSAAMPAASDTLTHVSGATHTTDIDYTELFYENRNPFWDSGSSEVSFTTWFQNIYTDKYDAGEKIDLAIILLGWNNSPYNKLTPEDWAAWIADAKILIDNIHKDYPDCKVFVQGIQYPCMIGGLGHAYGAAENSGANLWKMVRGVQALNVAYQNLANSVETSGVSGDTYASFVTFINSSIYFDSYNNMPKWLKQINLRNPDQEYRGNNGIHPSYYGYLQMADVTFRNMLKISI